jgi:hypothetical protein
MQVLNKQSTLWSYLPEEIKGLLEDGETVLSFVEKYREKEEISDYSFLVFPFSKAYEGFLKRFLFDTGLIREEDYYSDEIRIGRILNPSYVKERSNVFNRLCDKSPDGRGVPKKLWMVWKRGRNLVFHYFPHNFRKLEYDEAVEIINEIVDAMNSAVMHCRV